MLLCVVAATMALVSPGRWHLGPVQISVRSLRNPVYGFFLMWLAWCSASPAIVAQARVSFTRMRLVWKQQPMGRRTVLALLAAQALLATNSLVSFPGRIASRIHNELRLEREFSIASEVGPAKNPADAALVAAVGAYADPALDTAWQQYSLADRYGAIREASWAADRVARATEPLPNDARILYHGGSECMILAYEMYPCRVFMLPDEQAATCEDWMFAAEKKLPIHWPQSLVPPRADREQFLREHRITHDIGLVNSHKTAMLRVRRLR
jgi:hypothetical protein